MGCQNLNRLRDRLTRTPYPKANHNTFDILPLANMQHIRAPRHHSYQKRKGRKVTLSLLILDC